MRGAWARVAVLGMLGVLLFAAAPVEPSVLVGVLGVLVLACALGRGALAAQATAGPAAAVREHRRTLARRAVPRQRDPDAPGHTRSRAPSGPVPAV